MESGGRPRRASFIPFSGSFCPWRPRRLGVHFLPDAPPVASRQPVVGGRALKAYVRFFSRILAYFRGDLHLIASLVVLIGVSLAVGVLMVWPVSILVDVVFAPKPKADRLYTAFLSLVPTSTLGRVV